MARVVPGGKVRVPDDVSKSEPPRAVPLMSEYITVTSRPETADNSTSTAGSVTSGDEDAADANRTTGVGSLSPMATVALFGRPSSAPPATPNSSTVNVSLGSSSASLAISTTKLLSPLSPLSQDNLPEFGVKSPPALAVPSTVRYPTLTAPPAPPIRCAVIVTAFPASPGRYAAAPSLSVPCGSSSWIRQTCESVDPSAALTGFDSHTRKLSPPRPPCR